MDDAEYTYKLQPYGGKNQLVFALQAQSLNVGEEAPENRALRAVITRTVGALNRHGLPRGFPTIGSLAEKELQGREALRVQCGIGCEGARLIFDTLRENGLMPEKVASTFTLESGAADLAEALRAKSVDPKTERRDKKTFSRLANAIEQGGLPQTHPNVRAVHEDRVGARTAFMEGTVNPERGREPVKLTKMLVDELFRFLDGQFDRSPGVLPR